MKMVTLRVPRAPNLNNLKLLLSKVNKKQRIYDLMEISEFNKRSYLDEYIELLVVLGWVLKHENVLILTERGEEIKNKLDINTHILNSDVDLIRTDFMNIRFIDLFIKNIYNIDFSNNKLSQECLVKEEIIKRYNSYRDVSKSVAERESRTIYNWLLNLEVLGSLKSLSSKKERGYVCYYFCSKKISFNEFSKKIKLAVFKALNGGGKKSEWVEIPKVRNLFCVENNISKSEFDGHLLKYNRENPKSFQLSPATFLRKEVENEGIKDKSKYYFYIRLIREI
ncbi:hypothetical protein IPdc08_00009 [archaeon]|nr:hypothetical protein IPdc08_00009 [archaeon]